MAIRELEFSYSVASLSSPAAIPIDLPLPDCEVQEIRIELGDVMDGGDATFNVTFNGVNMFSGGDRPTIADTDSSATKTGLTQAAVYGDYLRLILEAITGGTVTAPIMVYVTIDDGVAVGVTDGDKGDITVSSSGTVWNIDAGVVGTTEIANDAVTYAKMQNVSATSRILGRKTGGAGDTEEITIEEALNFIASLAQGDILYHNGTNFVRLAAGTSGQFLKTLGAGANPAWDTIAGGGDLLASNNLSDVANAGTARTNLGLAIGTNVQAYDADLTTWAGITPGANVGTFLATPSSANLAAALTDETGSGSAVFGTAPTLNNPKLNLDASQASDDNYAGVTIDGRNAASGGLTQWDACYISTASEFALADANGSSTYPAIGLVVANASAAANATVLTHGVARNDAWNWSSIGQPIYLSTTPGGLTQTAPSTSGDKVQVMGIAISADEMLVMPQLTYITIT